MKEIKLARRKINIISMFRVIKDETRLVKAVRIHVRKVDFFFCIREGKREEISKESSSMLVCLLRHKTRITPNRKSSHLISASE